VDVTLTQWSGRIAFSCSRPGDGSLAVQSGEVRLSPLSRSRLPRQDFALNLSAKRRLCNTVGGRIVEGCAASCCRRISLRRSCRALSRRDYDQLSALEPGPGLARPLWRSKELRARQPLHDLPRPSAFQNGPLTNSNEPPTSENQSRAGLRVRAELARGHVLDHALAQRTDSIGGHSDSCLR